MIEPEEIDKGTIIGRPYANRILRLTGRELRSEMPCETVGSRNQTSASIAERLTGFTGTITTTASLLRSYGFA